MDNNFIIRISSGYMDNFGLVTNRRCEHSEKDVSGNGVMYTGEFLAILDKRNEMLSRLPDIYTKTMNACMVEPGLLKRSPDYPDQEGPDDYYGFAAGCIALKATTLARSVLNYGYSHWGSFNNVTPGVWTLQAFLWRQPQLLACLIYASGKKPFFLLRLVAALSILISCINTPTSNTDSRRLSWLLIYCTRASWLCRLASKVWYRRLYKDYGPTGMRAVAAIYYEVGHPFATYWID